MIVTPLGWLAVIGKAADRFVDVHPSWGMILPLVLGLWTANLLETDD